jgi:transposase
MSNVKALKARQLNAIQLLAVGTPANQVAATLQVSTMTLYRWSRQPEFEAKLRSITSSGLEEVAEKMNATALTAVETLQEILCDMTQPTGTRMKAALGVLAALPVDARRILTI